MDGHDRSDQSRVETRRPAAGTRRVRRPASHGRGGEDRADGGRGTNRARVRARGVCRGAPGNGRSRRRRRSAAATPRATLPRMDDGLGAIRRRSGCDHGRQSAGTRRSFTDDRARSRIRDPSPGDGRAHGRRRPRGARDRSRRGVQRDGPACVALHPAAPRARRGADQGRRRAQLPCLRREPPALVAVRSFGAARHRRVAGRSRLPVRSAQRAGTAAECRRPTTW